MKLVINLLLIFSAYFFSAGSFGGDLGYAIQYNEVFSALPLMERGQYAAVSRSPDGAFFFIFNLKTEKVEKKYKLGSSLGSWPMLLDGDYIYIGTYQPAAIYRYSLSTDKIKKITEFPTSQFVWSIEKKDEDLYVGLGYSGGMAILDSNTGIQKYYYGFGDKEFVRSIELHNSKIYLGIGPNAALVEYEGNEEISGNILPEKYQSESVVYWMKSVDDDLLLALNPSDTILIFNPRKNEYRVGLNEAINAPLMEIKDVASSFVGYGDLFYEFDKENHKITRVLYPPLPLSGGFFDGNRLLGFTRHGKFLEYSIDGQLIKKTEIDLMNVGLPKAPQRPFSTYAYNHKLYVGGRVLRVFDIKSKDDINHVIYGEPKSLCVANNYLYSAHYTGAVIWRFPLNILNSIEANLTDEKYKYWDMGESQNRPQSMVCTDKVLAIGTEPDYGQYGGALGIIIFSTGERRLIRNIVPNHTVFSVAIENDNIFIGTAAVGGSGTHWLDEDAKVVRYNYKTGKVKYSVSPVKGNNAIRSMVVLNNVLYSVMDTGEIVMIDAENGRVLKKRMSIGAKEFFKAENGDLLLVSRGGISYVNRLDMSQKLLARAKNPENVTEDLGRLYWLEDKKIKFLDLIK